MSVLWVGHATALVQLYDRYVLTDPVFTETVGGFSRRLIAPGLAPQSLPRVDVALISHRHFDHLSKDSIQAIGAHLGMVIVPPGAAGDVPPGTYQTMELETWRSWENDGLRVTAVPAAHEGNRWLHDRASHPRAFTGYVVEYRGIAVYFAGDTAFRQEMFAAIRKRFPRIALALLPIGPIAPERMMRPHHLTPEEAVEAARVLGAARVVPIHFSTFLHSYDNPGDCERRYDAAAAALELDGVPSTRLAVGERRVLVAMPPLSAVEKSDVARVTSPATSSRQ